MRVSSALDDFGANPKIAAVGSELLYAECRPAYLLTVSVTVMASFVSTSRRVTELWLASCTWVYRGSPTFDRESCRGPR